MVTTHGLTGPPDGGGGRLSASIYTGGFLRARQVRRILSLAGIDLRLGLPRRGTGLVAVWGRTRPAARGQWVARKFDAGLITVEDAFLRSVLTGRAGVPPLGIVIDRRGIYFDSTGPSDLEHILNTAPLAAPDMRRRAASALARLCAAGLSKYNAFEPGQTVGETGYVLVIDQTRNDASIILGGADAGTFVTMLAAAKHENPGKTILIKTHPEVAARYRRGYFGASDGSDTTRLITAPLSPWMLFEGAAKVYTVSSQMGFEAILAGHKPHIFGRPFYGGWGLSHDRQRFERRARRLTMPDLFAGAMLLYPTWYDPYRDTLCDFEAVVDNLEAQARAWREDCKGYMAMGMRLWKRTYLRQFFQGAGASLAFEPDLLKAAANGRRGLIWASKETEAVQAEFKSKNRPLLRLEDGFLRSRGLGANLVPPLSLVVDNLGIYYDPTRESRLETLLNAAPHLPKEAIERARNLRARLIAAGLSKYNTGAGDVGTGWPTDRQRILVPGQVEDDASIRFGTGKIARNLDLLRATRAQNPDAFIIYKPHPDIEAGLRPGDVAKIDAQKYADVVLSGKNAIAAIEACDAVLTMTSLLGFEALLRQKTVTCLGTPFYAGWGLTQDFGPPTPRRKARIDLDALVHAVLIDYPRYHDPVTGLACPVEVVVDRLENGPDFRPHRALSKLQGIFASFAPVWR